MKKINTLFPLFALSLIVTACNSPVNQSTTTHVKDLVQSDVFGVLPEYNLEIIVYNNPEEIGSEYLELAKVEIQETSEENTMTNVLERLKTEAKNLGGNGILLTESEMSEKGKVKTHTVKGIAVYALGRIPEKTLS